MASLIKQKPGIRILTARRLAAWLVILAAAGVVSGQGGTDYTGTGGRHSIQGRIYFPSGRRSDVAAVKVSLESSSSERLSVMADLNGRFVFTSLAPGSYSITVDAGKEYEIARDTVFIDASPKSRSMSPAEIAMTDVGRTINVIINLQPKRYGNEAKTGVVNAALANVPKPALDLYNKALDLARNKSTWNQAIDQLKAAVSLYPDFGLAYSEMGVLYLKLNQQDKALEALQSALKLIPNDYATLLTYGMILYDRQQFPAAEEQFRKAIEKNHLSPSGHLYLAMTLLKRHAYEEAEKEFRDALQFGGEDVAIAHYYLGGIYWNRKQYKQAADELDTYLKQVPNAPDSERLRATIKDLRHKQG